MKQNFRTIQKHCIPRVCKYCSCNKQPDCNSKEEDTQKGLRLRTKICFFWQKRITLKVKVKMNVPYVEVKLSTS